MSDPSDPGPDPGSLRLLRVLVTTLLGVMIAGFVVIVALFVIRFSDAPMPMPDTITLPDGARATAVTVGEDWYGVVTDDNRILIYERSTGALRQSVTVLDSATE